MHFVIKLLQFVITVAFCIKNVAFCNKKLDAFCNKLLSYFVIKQLSHFVITSVTFCNKLSLWIKYETVTLLTTWASECLCPMSLSPLSLKSGGEWGVYFCQSTWTHIPERLGIFAWKLNHANAHTNLFKNVLANSILKSEISAPNDCLVFFYFLLFFC